MQVIPVTDQNSRLFIELAVELYKNDKNWIRPLNKDIEEVFDEKKNKAFRFGKAQRWILLDGTGNPAGRIAAFINKKYKNKGDDMPVGGIGFFECINNQDAANLLLDKAKDWLKEQGMQAMDGPINFGERDKWWGMIRYGNGIPSFPTTPSSAATMPVKTIWSNTPPILPPFTTKPGQVMAVSKKLQKSR